MLRRLNPSEFQTALGIGSFILTLGVFLFFFIRALLMKPETADRLSHLPLQDTPDNESRHD